MTCARRKPLASAPPSSTGKEEYGPIRTTDLEPDPGVDFAAEDLFRCGVILGSGIGGLITIEEQHERLLRKGVDRVSALTVPRMMLNAAGGNVAIKYGLRGINYSVATACASATNAIGDALSPSTIQAAVHAGHLFAREFEAPIPNEVPYRLERIDLAHQLP